MYLHKSKTGSGGYPLESVEESQSFVCRCRLRAVVCVESRLQGVLQLGLAM